MGDRRPRRAVFLAAVVLAVAAPASVARAGSPIVVVGYALSDNGDHDGFADSNETANLHLVVSNTGAVGLTGIVARLTSADAELACPTQSLTMIPSLAAGEVRTIDDAFVVRIDDRQRTGTCSISGAACTLDVSCTGGPGDVCHAPFADFAATLRVTFSSDQFPGISEPQELRLDLDLNTTGGSGPTTFFESFESGDFGAFTPSNLDLGRHSLAASDGYRCQYNDPDFANSNSWQYMSCMLGASVAQADAYHWQVDGPPSPYGGRAFSGTHSMYMGLALPGGLGYTTPAAMLEAAGSEAPIHLGWDRVCSVNRATPCAGDAECPPGESCVRVTPTLSIKHQVSLVDSRTINALPGQAPDRAVVQAQLADAAGAPVGDWIRLEPYLNVYDAQGADNYYNCTFDPVDDGNTEDDFYDPTDPYRRLGPSSTCFPERSFVFLGDTDEPFAPDRIGRASHGPGLHGSAGPGTWIESRFDLSHLRGRSLRLRFLASTIELGTIESWEQAFAFNPDPGDDGWWIDDVTVTDTLTSQATLVADTTDNSAFPDLPDGDGDTAADACDNCPSSPNATQDDVDGDLIGDPCDACPLDAGNDADADGLCCDVDNCCDRANPGQEDSDGDGAGDLCDVDPVITVSADPTHAPDFRTIQQAVDFAVQSGTRIRIMPGTYDEQIEIDRGMVFFIEGVDDGSGRPVIVDGSYGAAFHFRSTAGTLNASLRNLTIRGAFGVIGDVPLTIEDCVFDHNSVTAIDLSAPGNIVRRVAATTSTTQRGFWIRPAASVLVEHVRLQNLAGAGLYVEGLAVVRNVLITDGYAGIMQVDSPTGLVLENSTIASNQEWGVDLIGGLGTVASSIIHGNREDIRGVDCSAVHGSIVGNQDCSAVNGNLFTDPQLTADFHLGPTSPALDRGPDPSTFDGVPRVDLDGGPRLRDHDGDGLAQMDIGAFERENLALLPHEARGLAWPDKQTLIWDQDPSAQEFHVYRGAIADLGFDDFGVCRDDLRTAGPALTDPELPSPGQAFHYQITIEDQAGAESSLGVGTCVERSNFAPCP